MRHCEAVRGVNLRSDEKLLHQMCRGVAPNTHPVFPPEVAGRYLKRVLSAPTERGWAGCIYGFSQRKSHISKHEVCILLPLLPNTSVVLEQMSVFKIIIIAELTIQDSQQTGNQGWSRRVCLIHAWNSGS